MAEYYKTVQNWLSTRTLEQLEELVDQCQESDGNGAFVIIEGEEYRIEDSEAHEYLGKAKEAQLHEELKSETQEQGIAQKPFSSKNTVNETRKIALFLGIGVVLVVFVAGMVIKAYYL